MRFEASFRKVPSICGGLNPLGWLQCVSHYMYNQLTLKPMPNNRPPQWIDATDKRLRLVLPKPDDTDLPVVTCRFFASKNILLLEFEAEFDKCYEDYDPTKKYRAPALDLDTLDSIKVDGSRLAAVEKRNVVLELGIAESAEENTALRSEVDAIHQEMTTMRQSLASLLGGAPASRRGASVADTVTSARGSARRDGRVAAFPDL